MYIYIYTNGFVKKPWPLVCGLLRWLTWEFWKVPAGVVFQQLDFTHIKLQSRKHSICTIIASQTAHVQKVYDWVMENKASICHHVLAAMVDDAKGLSLVRERRELEERYKLSFTSQILNVKNSADNFMVVKPTQEYIIKEDQTLLLNKVSNYIPCFIILL